MRRLANTLEEAGLRTHAPSLRPSHGGAPLEALAGQLGAFVEAEVEPSVPLALVGFSMGGLVARYYLQRLGGKERVQRLITLSTPHRGTWTGYGWPGEGSAQMRPGSDFLADLNADAEVLDSLDPLCLWTPFDLMILPVKRSYLDRWHNRSLPVLVHRWMALDRRVRGVVAEELSGPPAPDDSSCRAVRPDPAGSPADFRPGRADSAG